MGLASWLVSLESTLWFELSPKSSQDKINV